MASPQTRRVGWFATEVTVDDDAPGPRLNESQRRHFEVVLAKLEDTLDEIDRLAHAGPQAQPPSLTSLADDLPADFASRAAALS